MLYNLGQVVLRVYEITLLSLKSGVHTVADVLYVASLVLEG